MTIVRRARFTVASKDAPEIRVIARVSRTAYERHSRSAGVQKLIANARATWKRHNGSDPAAARLKGPR
jgi:hypothetical protein